MGVDTKMFIAIKKEAILEIMPVVIKSINEWQRNELDNYWSKKGFNSRVQYIYRDKESELNKGLLNYSNGITSVDTYDFRSFNVNFSVNGETRSLFVTHSCSNDYSDTYKGDKIIFSLGSYGMSKEIINVVMDSLSCFGDIYYTYNDCEMEFLKYN